VRVLGIDPGAAGALALVQGHTIRIYDMPSLSVRRGRSDKDEIDGWALMALLRDLQPEVAYIEQVGGIEGQSASSAFNFGRAAGAPEYLLMGMGVRFARVSPIRWKKALRIKSGKDDARIEAMRRWPFMAAEFRKRRPDFAEAALIAEYGRLEERDRHDQERDKPGLFD
jgi:Holliday junction resolvasome RuvABC endonuclease subunit